MQINSADFEKQPERKLSLIPQKRDNEPKSQSGDKEQRDTNNNESGNGLGRGRVLSVKQWKLKRGDISELEKKLKNKNLLRDLKR